MVKKTLLIIKYSIIVVLIIIGVSVIGVFSTRSIIRSNHLNSSTIDTSEGIDEMFTLEIGGITQYFHVRGGFLARERDYSREHQRGLRQSAA